MEKLIETRAVPEGLMDGAGTASDGLVNGVRAIGDEQLLNLCVKFGARALKWRRKFTGLLPEVQRRRLYEKKGFNSIFEFAYKLAGLSEKQVRVVLNLESRFHDKPVLKSLLESGEVSVNKLARMVSIATKENEQELADKVRILPQSALETLVRDQKIFEKAQNGKDLPNYDDSKSTGFCSQNDSNKPLFKDESLRVQTLNFEISEEVVAELNHLNFQGHDVNKIILELLQKRKEEIERRKEELAQEAIERRDAKNAAHEQGATTAKLKTSRYISVKVLSVLKEEYGTKCSIPHCKKPAQGNHHSQRLALVGIHDPRYIAPMCKEHHQIAHMIDQKYVEKSRRGS